tara:strand:- start:718 stop:909 length:192 start_codon:yes stop_codon:yes gene_type:complete
MRVTVVCPPGYTATVTYPKGMRIPFTDYYVSMADEEPERFKPAPLPVTMTQGISPEDAFKMCE